MSLPTLDGEYDKNWAQKYLIEPLTSPEPSQIHFQESAPRPSTSSSAKSRPVSRPVSIINRDPVTGKFVIPAEPIYSPAGQTAWDFHPSNPFSSHSRTQSTSQVPIDTRPVDLDPFTPTHRRFHSLPEQNLRTMAPRTLDTIKKEHKTAHRRHRSRPSQTDIIDSLDTVGGAYHHSGPFDAASASWNTHKKYSPLEAVRDSNMEALKATPPEYIKDSLERNLPLQGTATIPSGYTDLSGNVMEYEEGTDMMRDPTAGGGAYKRWDGITYHPDDLKGKGSEFEYERDLKLKKAQGQEEAVEMLPQRSSHNFRNGDDRATSAVDGISTGRRVADGVKRRLGGLSRKRDVLVN